MPSLSSLHSSSGSVPRLARKHGPVAESRRVDAAQHSTRRGRLGDKRPLVVLRHGLRRVVLFLPSRPHLRSFESVQLDFVDRAE